MRHAPAPPNTGPEWDAAPTLSPSHHDSPEQRWWPTGSRAATLLLEYSVWLRIPIWRYLHKMNFIKELRVGWGQT